jgi:homoserine dehydrogenase
MCTVGVFGFGNVGRTLARQAKDVGIRVSLVADSSGVLVSNAVGGFNRKQLAALGEAKSAGKKLSAQLGEWTVFESASEALDSSKFKLCVKPVLADCSAFESPEAYLLPALKRGIPVALANKKPLTGKYEWYEQLMASRSKIGIEATCGAGLPVMVTCDRLIDSGDKMTRVEGQLSGTLGYVLSALEAGGKFSEIVAEAKALGYTEPDPRDDLSGLDVARKALILGRRFLGKEAGSMADVKVEALYPPEFGNLSIDEFMRRLPELDALYAEKVANAAKADKRLRYCAVVEPGKQIVVGLQEVPADSALAGLKGTDNLIAFKTKWYNGNPLVVRGPGAGAEVTAGGVLADIAMLVHKNYMSGRPRRRGQTSRAPPRAHEGVL